LGIYNSSISISVAKGINDHRTGTRVDTGSLYPMGSVTKTYTAAAALQLSEKGLLDLDSPMSIYVDPILTRLNSTTLAKLFPDDPRVKAATMRQFLQMRSGMADYNDEKMEAWTLAHPDSTFTPLDYLANVSKHLRCSPGECGVYSSTGYDVVGLALAQISGANNWSEYDQRSVLPPQLAKQLNRTIFPNHGKCSDYPTIVHQYRPTKDASFLDIDDYSCTNGWTMVGVDILSHPHSHHIA
jgi:CubicO group peptidase (beta-lactamase class C family)